MLRLAGLLVAAAAALGAAEGRYNYQDQPVDWLRPDAAEQSRRGLVRAFMRPAIFLVRPRVLPVFKGYEDARYQRYDAVIEQAVAELNQRPELWVGCTEEQGRWITGLDPGLVKAWLIQESGGGDPRSRAAWDADPAQVNVPGDWSEQKADLGLKPPRSRNQGEAGDNIRAALRYLARKSFGRAAQAPAKRGTSSFDGWRTALERYNGRSDRDAQGRPYRENYAERILARARAPRVHHPIQLPETR